MIDYIVGAIEIAESGVTILTSLVTVCRQESGALLA
jgi:hypothetical protein